jgi:hypothetical protein
MQIARACQLGAGEPLARSKQVLEALRWNDTAEAKRRTVGGEQRPPAGQQLIYGCTALSARCEPARKFTGLRNGQRPGATAEIGIPICRSRRAA